MKISHQIEVTEILLDVFENGNADPFLSGEEMDSPVASRLTILIIL